MSSLPSQLTIFPDPLAVQGPNHYAYLRAMRISTLQLDLCSNLGILSPALIERLVQLIPQRPEVSILVVEAGYTRFSRAVLLAI